MYLGKAVQDLVDYAFNHFILQTNQSFNDPEFYNLYLQELLDKSKVNLTLINPESQTLKLQARYRSALAGSVRRLHWLPAHPSRILRRWIRNPTPSAAVRKPNTGALADLSQIRCRATTRAKK